LKAEYLFLDYKRASIPGERLLVDTHLTGLEGRLCSFSHSIKRSEDSAEIVASEYVYGWADNLGEPVDPPPGLL
jgi:acyl-CoA thioesterase FadM